MDDNTQTRVAIYARYSTIMQSKMSISFVPTRDIRNLTLLTMKHKKDNSDLSEYHVYLLALVLIGCVTYSF